MTEDELIETMAGLASDDNNSEDTNAPAEEISDFVGQSVGPAEEIAISPTAWKVEDCSTIHDYIFRHTDKLVNCDILNDNMHQIDEEMDITDTLIFNDKTAHKCVVLDIRNLYIPNQFPSVGDMTSMKCCQSGIIIDYTSGRMYVTKNNIFVVVHNSDGKVSSIYTYYRAKNGEVKFNIQSEANNPCADIEMIKFAIKSRCVRIYNSIKNLEDSNEICNKLMTHYGNVVDINNLIKIEGLRFDIGC